MEFDTVHMFPLILPIKGSTTRNVCTNSVHHKMCSKNGGNQYVTIYLFSQNNVIIIGTWTVDWESFLVLWFTCDCFIQPRKCASKMRSHDIAILGEWEAHWEWGSN